VNQSTTPLTDRQVGITHQTSTVDHVSAVFARTLETALRAVQAAGRPHDNEERYEYYDCKCQSCLAWDNADRILKGEAK